MTDQYVLDPVDVAWRAGNDDRPYRLDEYGSVPAAYRPWPYRDSNAPWPTRCPRCNRRLLFYVWNDGPFQNGYLEAACAGFLQPLMRWRPTWLFTLHHFQLCIGRAKRTKYLISPEWSE